MNVGILGSGSVAQALGEGALDRGHEVKLSSRDPAKLAEWVATAGDDASVGSFADAAAFAEVVVLAVKGTETESVLESAGRDNTEGKVLIDVTNPLVSDEGSIPRLAYGPTDSGGEVVQRIVPDARVVKSLNIVNAAQMVDPEASGGPPTMFVAGDDDEAKGIVTDLLEEFGWKDVVDLGGIDASRELESLCVLWCRYAIPNQGWQATFKLLR